MLTIKRGQISYETVNLGCVSPADQLFYFSVPFGHLIRRRKNLYLPLGDLFLISFCAVNFTFSKSFEINKAKRDYTWIALSRSFGINKIAWERVRGEILCSMKLAFFFIGPVVEFFAALCFLKIYINVLNEMIADHERFSGLQPYNFS